jgi:hypothetical protein
MTFHNWLPYVWLIIDYLFNSYDFEHMLLNVTYLNWLNNLILWICIHTTRLDENNVEYGCFESKLWFEGPMDSPFFMLHIYVLYLIRSLHIVSTTLYNSYLYFKKMFVSLIVSPFYLGLLDGFLKMASRPLSKLALLDSRFGERWEDTNKLGSLVLFIRWVRRVIRCLTTLLVWSPPLSSTNCSCTRRPEGCPVSNQESSTNWLLTCKMIVQLWLC